jgi:superfamily II DNA helicase RecQ
MHGSLQKSFLASAERRSSHDAVLIINIERLRKWRLKEAGKMPAYHVFSDRTMEELATTMPRTEEELRLVHGIGPGKIERFGTELLEFLQELSESTAAAAV